MGIFEKTEICPECRTAGAVKPLFGKVKCPNPRCSHHDAFVPRSPSTVVRSQAESTVAGSSVFDPGEDRCTIQYRNFRGEEREFVADRSTLRARKQHISACVAPTGKRIALAKKFIKNLGAVAPVETHSPATGVERQIWGYHKKHGTTSPRFEALRRKYPDWK